MDWSIEFLMAGRAILAALGAETIVERFLRHRGR